MKTFVYFAIVTCVVFFMGCQPQAKPPLTQAERAAIEKTILEKYVEVINSVKQLDVEKFYSFILDSGQGSIIRNCQLMTRTESLNSSRQNFARLQKLEYEFDEQYVKVISRKTAILIGKGKFNVTTKTGESFTNEFVVSNVFVLKDGEWKIFHGHHSIPPRQ